MDRYTDKAKSRVRQADVDDLFVNRWSPRAMTGEILSEKDVNSLFEAARFAPSSMNNQPWRFLISKRDDENWQLFFNLLTEGNQVWCKDASVLIVLISKKTLDKSGKEYKTHSLEAGSAWQNLALQASLKNIVSHGMGGFDYEKAKSALNIPDDYKVEMMIALGKYNKKLSDEKQEKISDRKPLNELVFKGKFN